MPPPLQGDDPEFVLREMVVTVPLCAIFKQLVTTIELHAERI